ncbi:hypothetical protein VHEMI00556 [[Torrubiella] hemipterigena]|uniref:Uncharacterized protein n=1 Tax=[Torrubiella] hemipterigena TaxID=1531966 RepID=A0A0A1SQR0_9HYPO|nr:hypothetical protein VHEMI00556 [[Torrubiella] hemipterigena]
MPTVAVIGTCDTKLAELIFLRDRILENSSVKTIIVDVGRHHVKNDAITISTDELATLHGTNNDWQDLSRGEFVKFISKCATEYIKSLYKDGKIDAIVSAGGSGGTALTSTVMRDAVPIGVPKLIVSTIASGNTAEIIGDSDIALMYSVVDVAGLNRLLRQILTNAGSSIAAAAISYAAANELSSEHQSSSNKKQVGITMFGVTTPGADAIRKFLESNYPIEVYVFHATGTGGKSMERLVREGKLDAIIDLTTTEICDHVMGGVMSAGESRLSAALQAEIPTILSLGATDMANFRAKDSVPAKYGDRKLHEHNPLVTLVRTSVDDCKEIGRFIVSKLQQATKPELIEVWIPHGGVSMISTAGGPFEDRDADNALFKTIKDGLVGSSIAVIDDKRDINDSGFATDIARALVKKLNLG